MPGKIVVDKIQHFVIVFLSLLLVLKMEDFKYWWTTFIPCCLLFSMLDKTQAYVLILHPCLWTHLPKQMEVCLYLNHI